MYYTFAQGRKDQGEVIDIKKELVCYGRTKIYCQKRNDACERVLSLFAAQILSVHMTKSSARISRQ